MSSRANLLSVSAFGASGGTPPPPPRPLITPPVVDDPIVNQMRPDPKYGVAQALIAHDGTGDFTTFSEAFESADDLRAIAMAAGGVSTSNARYRVDFFVKPGVYDDHPTIAAPINAAFYALDPTPGSTTLNWGISTGQPGNNSLYWEGININNPATTYDPKYPIHHANLGTTIFTRCTLWNNGKGTGGGATGIGMDGNDHGTLVLHDVTIRDGGTNLHGWPSPQKSHPETVVLSKVRADGAIGYGASNDTVADEVWFSGCQAPELIAGGAASRMHVSGCTADRVRHVRNDDQNSDFGITDTRSDWPVPVGGLSAYDRQKWGL